MGLGGLIAASAAGPCPSAGCHSTAGALGVLAGGLLFLIAFLGSLQWMRWRSLPKETLLRATESSLLRISVTFQGKSSGSRAERASYEAPAGVFPTDWLDSLAILAGEATWQPLAEAWPAVQAYTFPLPAADLAGLIAPPEGGEGSGLLDPAARQDVPCRAALPGLGGRAFQDRAGRWPQMNWWGSTPTGTAWPPAAAALGSLPLCFSCSGSWLSRARKPPASSWSTRTPPWRMASWGPLTSSRPGTGGGRPPAAGDHPRPAGSGAPEPAGHPGVCLGRQRHDPGRAAHLGRLLGAAHAGRLTRTLPPGPRLEPEAPGAAHGAAARGLCRLQHRLAPQGDGLPGSGGPPGLAGAGCPARAVGRGSGELEPALGHGSGQPGALQGHGPGDLPLAVCRHAPGPVCGLERWVKERAWVVMRLPSGTMGREGARLTAGIFYNVFDAAFRKATLTDPVPFYFIIDEAQEIGGGMRLEAMLSEGAKFGARMLVLAQSLSMMRRVEGFEPVVQALLANTSTQAFFSPDPEDADLIRATLSVHCALRADHPGPAVPAGLAAGAPGRPVAAADADPDRAAYPGRARRGYRL